DVAELEALKFAHAFTVIAAASTRSRLLRKKPRLLSGAFPGRKAEIGEINLRRIVVRLRHVLCLKSTPQESLSSPGHRRKARSLALARRSQRSWDENLIQPT